MKDNVKCQHSLSQDVIYKEVVIIGNGPSGMVTSFMLAGNVPYLKQIPDDLPIDEMLRARLSNLTPGQSLYEADLMALAEGLEGRCQNPIPLLMDNLLRPCADLGFHADSLIEWRFEEDKQVDHIVLGRGPPGGAWQSFPARVRTLSPGAWLSLPPHSAAGLSDARLTARAVANYCRRYVHACKLQRYFRSGVVVTGVSRVPPPPAAAVTPPCPARHCPTGARYYVTARETNGGRQFTIACARVVIAAGGTDRPNLLRHVTHATHDLAAFERALHSLHDSPPPSVLVIGSGVSAADAVLLSRGASLHTHHVHRTPADALARLAPQAYPDYCHVYKMMCDGPPAEHPLYSPHPDHVVMKVSPVDGQTRDHTLRPKRVTLLDLKTNLTTEITVSLIGVFIGAKPDLFFLQNDWSCDDITKRKMEEKQCFLKNHWSYIKSVLGQSLQSCKSRYLSYTEINDKCLVPECDKIVECQCKVVPYFDKCQCDDPSDGIGFGVDQYKPVECRANPVAVDRGTHEVVKMGGVYALGPLTGDNFVRFIPGGALAIVSHIHKRVL